MSKILAVVAAVVVVLGGIAWYVYETRQEPAAEAAPAVEIAPEPAAPAVDAVAEPEVAERAPSAEPSPQLPEKEPLPVLEESDAYVTGTLDDLVGEAMVMRFFTRENIVHKAVATVDALGARQVPRPILVLNGPSGDYPVVENPDPETVVRDEAGDPVPQYLSTPAAYERYAPYVEMLEDVEPDAFVGLLRENAPLFDGAFRQLGYTDGRFEDRLAAVIDELLATPEVEGPLQLMKPEAYYLFVDPDLEALSAGQKILLRMGSDQAARVKSWLSEVRKAL
jgi:hypothetical protein